MEISWKTESVTVSVSAVSVVRPTNELKGA